MSDRLTPLKVDVVNLRSLPLAFSRIMVSRDVIEDASLSLLVFDLTRYRHRATYMAGPAKPISKIDWNSDP